MQARKPIVWSAASVEGTAANSEAAATATTDPAAAEPSNTDAAETDLPAEASEEEKRKARANKFGVVDGTAPAKASRAAADASFIKIPSHLASQLGMAASVCHQGPNYCFSDADALVMFDLQESVKRKAEDPEAVALVSNDIIAKRQARFKTAEESAEEQRRQRFMDPDAVKAKERKERFGKWLPQDSGKKSKDDVAAAVGTSLDNSVAAKGRGRGKPNAAAPKEEKYSAEFMAKAEVCAAATVSYCISCQRYRCDSCPDYWVL